MKRTVLIKNSLLFIALVASTQTFAQSNIVQSRDQAQGWYLPVFGQIFENGEKCEGATVKVYIDNEELGSFPTTKKGAFRLELDLNNFYTIEVTKPGSLAKRISVDTHMAESIVNYPAYDCFVNLTAEDAVVGADMDYFDFPAAIVRYDGEQGGFYHSEHYLAHITDKVENAIAQASR